MPIEAKLTLDTKQYKSKLNGAAQDTNKVLNGIKKGSGGVTGAVTGIGNAFKALGGAASNSLGGIGTAFSQFGSLVTGFAMGPIGMLTAAISAAVAALGGVIKMGLDLDKIGKSAKGVGLTAQEMQALEYASKKAGIEISETMTLLTKIDDATKQAENGVSRYIKALHAVGLSYTDLKDKSPIDQFKEVAKAVQNMNGDLPTDFTDVFGKRSKQMFGKIGAEDDMVKNIDDFMETNKGASNDLVKKGEVFANAMTDFIQTLKDGILQSKAFGDALATLTEIINSMNQNKDAVKKGGGFIINVLKNAASHMTGGLVGMVSLGMDIMKHMMGVETPQTKDVETKEEEKKKENKKEEKKEEKEIKKETKEQIEAKKKLIEAENELLRLQEESKKIGEVTSNEAKDFTTYNTKGLPKELAKKIREQESQIRQKAEQKTTNFAENYDKQSQRNMMKQVGLDYQAGLEDLFDQATKAKGYKLSDKEKEGLKKVYDRNKQFDRLTGEKNALMKQMDTKTFTNSLTEIGGWAGGGMAVGPQQQIISRMAEIQDTLNKIAYFGNNTYRQTYNMTRGIM